MVNIREDFEYHDGHLYRLKSSRNVKQGDSFGCLDGTDGYVVGFYRNRKTSEHRLVWEYFNGPIQDDLEIDHVNGIRDDNRIENLRLANRNQNCHNRKINANSVTGVKGVVIDNRKGGTYYKGRVNYKGSRHAKIFPYTEEGLVLATSWVQAKRKELHDLEFVNHG